MPGHGLYLTNAQQNIAEIALGTSCDVEWLSALTACAQPTATHCAGRAYDLNGDGTPDSGGYLWSAHIFHSRDNIRQSVVDRNAETVRMIRSFDGKTLSAQDYNFDGTPDLAGDFDGDGTPDIGRDPGRSTPPGLPTAGSSR